MLATIIPVLLVLSTCSCLADASGAVVDAHAAQSALGIARQYVEAEYTVDGTTKTGVPYKLGGQTSIEDFISATTAGDDLSTLGIDASGLIVNCFRSAVPELRFRIVRNGQSHYVTDISSEGLFKWNIAPLTDPEQLRPGDLIFFRSSGGGIGGVAIVSRYSHPLVHFIVASSRAGKVIATRLHTQGTYWKDRIAGMGRLLVFDR